MNNSVPTFPPDFYTQLGRQLMYFDDWLGFWQGEVPHQANPF